VPFGEGVDANMTNSQPIHRMTVPQFEEAFPHEDACCAYLIAHRWPDGMRCPRCGSDRVYGLKTMKWKWECPQCAKGGAYRFSHIAGTILENTKIPLLNWFRFVHLMLTGREAMSVAQIQRDLGIRSYQTAWYMYHHVQALLGDMDFRRLVGITADDEIFIRGLVKNGRKGIHAEVSERQVNRLATH
jgi:transposase-like protein